MSRYDHGHVVFKDGVEVEFGWTEPSADELMAKGLWAIAAERALAWANEGRDPSSLYTEKDIARLRLAG